MKLAALSLGLVVLVGACVGDGYVSPNGEAGTFQTADGTEVECRRIKEMGTRLGKRVCMQPKEWAEVDKAAEEGAEGFMDSTAGAGRDMTPPGGIN